MEERCGRWWVMAGVGDIRRTARDCGGWRNAAGECGG